MNRPLEIIKRWTDGKFELGYSDNPEACCGENRSEWFPLKTLTTAECMGLLSTNVATTRVKELIDLVTEL
jgi:hypothetical protein